MAIAEILHQNSRKKPARQDPSFFHDRAIRNCMDYFRFLWGNQEMFAMLSPPSRQDDCALTLLFRGMHDAEWRISSSFHRCTESSLTPMTLAASQSFSQT
jgi:hypothetical protein